MDVSRELIVRQSNQLIETAYKIATVGESRLLRLLIAQIHPNDEDFKTYRISVSDFATAFGLSPTGGGAYEAIDRAAQGLAHRPITIRDGGSWLHTSWLSSSKYKAGDGYVELRFDANLKPYLLQLKGYYTQYKIEAISTFKSLYSIRIYEFLKMEFWKLDKEGQFSKKFEYEELREKLGIDVGEYAYVKDFRLYVIEIAKREINANNDIHIMDVEYQKTGRKITHIVFHCEKAKQTQLDLTQPEPELTEVKKEIPNDVVQLVSLGIAEDTAFKWRKKYGVGRIVRNIGYTLAMKKAGKIRDNEAGFLATAIANDSGGGWELEQKERDKKRLEKERLEAEITATAGSEAEDQRIKRQLLIDEFHALPATEQQAIRSVYEKQASSVVLMMWEKIKRTNPEAPEDDNRTRFDFAMFYKTYKANLRLPV
jgi:plasmid replication initiation protein